MQASRHLPFKGQLSLFVQSNKHLLEFSLLVKMFLFCYFIKISILLAALQLGLIVLLLNTLVYLCNLRKCLQISSKKVFPIFFLRFWLKGGLIVVSFTFLFECSRQIFFIEILSPVSLKADRDICFFCSPN